MILLTGFKPFGGDSVNPSWEAVRRVPDTVAGQTVHRLLLPVEFTRAGEMLREAIARLHPALVLCCGVASGRRGLTPELAALNYRHASIPDNAGQQPFAQPIDPSGPAAYLTDLPVHAMVAAMKDAGVPAYVSLSAGAYVCNDVYYALLSCQAEFGFRGLFLHVPGTDVADAETAARGMTICLETTLSQP